jgi:hypothetical protein
MDYAKGMALGSSDVAINMPHLRINRLEKEHIPVVINPSDAVMKALASQLHQHHF